MLCLGNYESFVVIAAISLYAIWRYCQGGRFKKNVRLNGKVAIITGANTGLGRENALDFARRGARVYMGCRNLITANAARDQIVQATNNENVFVLKLDLSSLQSVRDFVQQFQRLEQRLDLLVNNAGVTVEGRQLTVDGHEMTFGTNHLGHFLLTNLLLEQLKSSSPSRIVTVASLAHTHAQLNRDNLNSERSYGQFGAYCCSKLANVLFTRELAKRLSGTGVTANSLHPGVVRTDLLRNHPVVRSFLTPPAYLLMKSTSAGVQTQLAVALDPELQRVSGKYFSDCRVTDESAAAQDDETAAWLWQQSEQMVGLNKK